MVFMQNKAVKKVIIAGGGTAGWMTAAALANTFQNTAIEILLVESEQIGAIGVGEATLPDIIKFNQALNIDENEVQSFCSGTFKLGIEFENWGQVGSRYFHPFGNYGTELGHFNFYHYWQQANLNDDQASLPALGCFSVCEQAAKAGKFMQPTLEGNHPLSFFGYGYHFDASRYALFLRNYAEKRGVKRVEGKIEAVNQCPSFGNIQSLTLQSGQLLDADFFVDCTGIPALLIGKSLKVGYQDWSHWLRCDSAIAVQSEKLEQLPPFTRSIAHQAGWQWQIPLQHRTGNGLVFSSQYLQPEQAMQTLMDNLPSKPTTEPRLIRFTTGRRDEFWHKNCVAIGLSSGFLEPLESTSIHLIQSQISKLIALFPTEVCSQAEQLQYNYMLNQEFEHIRDFLILHYHLNQRQDSQFWLDCQQMSVPESLNNKMALYQGAGRISPDSFGVFGEHSWLAVLNGQGLKAQQSHPALTGIPFAVASKQLHSIANVTAKAVSRMPGHELYIQQHCAMKPEAS